MSRKYVNTTHYNTAPHDDKHPFLVISNEIIKDQRLSDEELGLMIRILNNSESYVFNSSYFQAHVSSLGERRYYKSLKHLQELGYIIKKPKQGGIDWIINEVPSNVITDKPKDANNNGSRLEDGVSTVPEVTNCDITTGKSTNREITNGETEVLTNNNETIINENIIKEISKNEITNNQIINNTNIEENTLLNNQDEVIEIDKEFERIFNFDDSVFSKLNIDNTGNDVIDKTGIDNYINKIKRTLNSEKFEELSNIFNEIGQLIIDKLDYKSFEKLFERKFGLLPQFFITKNNIKLSQLYLNLEDFIQDYEIKLKENKMNSTAQTTASKVHSKELKSKKVEVQENTNTTKVISIKSRTEINKLPTSGIVTEEKFIEFNKLIQENRTFNKEDRKESLLVILNSIQEYFKKIFGDKILELIKEGKTLQIHFNNQTSSTLNLIYLYQNAQDFYQSLIEEEISTMIDNELIQT